MTDKARFWTRGMKIFAIMATIWSGLWWMATGMSWSSADEGVTEAAFLSGPPTSVEPGADVRSMVKVDASPAVKSPLTKRDCVAALTEVHYATSHVDSQDRPYTKWRLISTKRVGPPRIGLVAGSARMSLPLERWTTKGTRWKVDEYQRLGDIDDALANDLGVSDADRKAASEDHAFAGFIVHERVMTADQEVFVAGRAQPGGSEVQLDASPALGRVELYPGTQQALVAELEKSARGARVAGWVFLGIGSLAWIAFGVIGLILHSRARTTREPPR